MRTLARHRLWLGGIAVITLVVIAIALARSSGAGDNPTEQATPAVATVRSGELSSRVYAEGTLTYEAQPDGSPYEIVNQASGAYTALPDPGTVVRCGRVLYRVDEDPVFLLCGSIPAFRSLGEGEEGPDVRILNRNLVRLGYAEEGELDPDSDYFGSATASALADLQEALGLEASGSLELGEAVVLPGPLRLGQTSATPGTAATPGTPIATATTTRRLVEADLEAARGAEVRVGDRARVTLPDNRTAGGVVSRIGAVASEGAEGGEPGGEAAGSTATIPVYVELDEPRRLGRLDQAPVQVEITTGRVKGALSVPVTAVTALAGGGYAVEVVESEGRRRLVEVEIGISDQASGTIEIEGDGIEAGDRVAVPSS